MKERGYELIDSGGGRKLERFAEYVVDRPSAAAVWDRRRADAWKDADAVFQRDANGSGTWHSRGRGLPERFVIGHAGLTWTLHPNDFGHLGIFPEQERCWRWIQRQVQAAGEAIEVLNLFAYTGGSTLAAAAAGARVCHLDASKTSVRSARENAALSGLEDKPIRWIVDDANRFVDREIRRERRYDGIVLDPPTYGRGSRGEIWKIEEDLRSLLDRCRVLLSDSPRFVLLSSHSPGFTPLVLANLIEVVWPGEVESGEMILSNREGRPLPSGAFACGGAA